jgi:hypothetical protein
VESIKTGFNLPSSSLEEGNFATRKVTMKFQEIFCSKSFMSCGVRCVIGELCSYEKHRRMLINWMRGQLFYSPQVLSFHPPLLMVLLTTAINMI